MRISKAPWRSGTRLPTYLCAAAMCVILAHPTMAATDGSLGATSTGTVTITASVPNRARLSGLADVSFVNHDPATAATSAQDVCAWTNTATKAYTMTATGSGSSGAFTLTNGSSTVPYSVQWSPSAAQSSGTTLVAGSASASLTSSATHHACSSGPATSASLIVGIASDDLSAMDAGSNYSGTLTLLISPQ